MKKIEIHIPGSKSITNRALIAAAAASGKTVLYGALESDDTKYMIAGLKKLGVTISKNKSTLTIHGGFKKSYKTTIKFFCGNSGTTLRFLTAIVATRTGSFIFDGDSRMRERPIKDLNDALMQCGAQVTYLEKEGFPPFKISGAIDRDTCSVSGKISSQFLSGLLLAAPLAKSGLSIEVSKELVSKSYIDITTNILESFGIAVEKKSNRYRVQNSKYVPQKYIIEADASSASYFWGISALTKTPIHISNLLVDSLQPDTEVKKQIEYVLHSKKGGTIDCVEFPDAAMTLACICATTNKKWKLVGLRTLRDKECDRVSALQNELRKIGCAVSSTNDSITISRGVNINSRASIKTYNDHRMAMCFGMLQIIIPGIKILNPKCVSKTFPTFWKELHAFKKRIQNRNIVLIGMRGAGKSTHAQLLGKELHRAVIDTDAEIEKKIGMPIVEYVEKNGWDKFRKVESTIITKISRVKNSIIATGGGVVLNPINMKALRQNGVCIYLSCPLAVLTKRLISQIHRPALNKNHSVTSELPRVFAERKPLYTQYSDAICEISKSSSESEAVFPQLIELVKMLGIS